MARNRNRITKRRELNPSFSIFVIVLGEQVIYPSISDLDNPPKGFCFFHQQNDGATLPSGYDSVSGISFRRLGSGYNSECVGFQIVIAFKNSGSVKGLFYRYSWGANTSGWSTWQQMQ